jgi:hypothetical protein
VSAESEVTTPPVGKKNRGVYETSYGGRWFAQIRRGGKLHYLGTYSSPDAAAEAYARAAEILS